MKKIELLIKESDVIERKVLKRREIENFSREVWELRKDGKIFTLSVNFNTINAYPIAAYYTNLLNSLMTQHISVRKELPLYKEELGRELFKHENFYLVSTMDFISGTKLNIELSAKSKIASIINNLLLSDEKISTKPKDVFDYINGNKKLKLEASNKIGSYLAIDGSSEKINILKRLAMIELIEDSYRYMNNYLKAQKKEDSFNEMLMFAQIIASNDIFSRAFLNIAIEEVDLRHSKNFTNNMSVINKELIGAFLLSLKSFNIPIFKMVKAENVDKLAEFIVNGVKELDKFLTKEQIYQVEEGLAFACSTENLMLSINEIMANSNHQFIYERIKKFFDAERTESNIKEEEETKNYKINILKGLKESFENKYQINPSELKMIINDTSLINDSYEEDIVLNIGAMLKEALIENASKDLSKKVVVKIDVRNYFNEMKFAKNIQNIVVFDKALEIFLDSCIKSKFPNVSVKSKSSLIHQSAFKEKLNTLTSGKLNKHILSSFSESYMGNDHKFEIKIPYSEKESVKDVEKLLNAILSIQVELMKKALKESKNILNKSNVSFMSYPEEYETTVLFINTMNTLMHTFKNSVSSELKNIMINEVRSYDLSQNLQNTNKKEVQNNVKKKI